MEDLVIWGTLINTFAVIIGAMAGGAFCFLVRRSKSDKLKTKMEEISSLMVKALGFPVLLIGITGAIKSQKTLVMILSVAIGALIGGILDIDAFINKIGQKIEGKMRNSGSVAAGFVNGTLLFCVGAMVINGALESGVEHSHSIFYAKALIDGVTAIFLAVSYGPVGLALTAIPVFVLQGSLSYLAVLVQPILSEAVINEMSAVGSLLIIGIGLNMLGATKIKVMNYVPAIFLPILLCIFL